MPIVRGMVGALLLPATLLAGCTALHPAPYNGQQACDSVGGFYTGDGRCLAGNM